MTRPAHRHDDILTAEERAASARKCLALLSPVMEDIKKRSPSSEKFVREQLIFRNNSNYAPSMVQLNWLRDLVSKHAS